MAVPVINLSSNTSIPQIGFGTWLNRDEVACKDSVKTALEVGYRHFDTAQIYDNERFVGEALAASSVPRSELFITTKIWNENMYWDDLVESFERSLMNLKTDYVDLLLLHFPVTELRRPAWRRMEELYKTGKTKAIGVSNYTIAHLEELLRECTIRPAVNQIELHVFLQQPELVQYCQDNNIAVEAYSPLAHGQAKDDPILALIAQKHHKTPQQIMIRWCIEKGLIPLPKSIHSKYIQQNFEVFDFSLDQDDMQKIANLDHDFRTCWDPTHVA